MGLDTVGKTNILLESGTNELEIVEFSAGNNIYGINVAKVREIIRFPDDVITIPDAHPSLEGIANIRGQVIPILNLPKHLGVEEEFDKSTSYIIISEFNNTRVGFCVSSVARIHRLSWKQIESPTGMISSDAGSVTAIVKLEDRMILLLDFEKITSDVNPGSGMQSKAESVVSTQDLAAERAMKKILVVEDSSYIQKIIVNNLEKAGYTVSTASDGQMAWDKLTALMNAENFRGIEEHFNIVISDIEMPRMDGLHLIKNIKENEKLKSVPCIVFSSLISDEMAAKCRTVGADSQISKPEISRLVELIDRFILSTPS